MATHTTIVDPGGSGVYTSLAAWVAGEAALSVSESWASGDIAFADCRRTTSDKDTTAVTISGFKAGIIPQIVVHADYRHEGKWADQRDDSNYIYVLRLASPGVSTAWLTISDDDINIYGLLFDASTMSRTDQNVIYSSSANIGSLIENCIAKGPGKASTSGNGFNFYTGSGSIRNSIAYGFMGNGIGGGAYNNSFASHNCTVYGCVVGFSSRRANEHILYNCYAGYCTTDYSGSYAFSGDYNVSSDTSAPGTNAATGKTSYTDYFVDPANGDFHLKDTSYNLWGINSENLYSTFTTDIDGDTRSNDNQFGIGADFYVSTGGGTTISIAALVKNSNIIIQPGLLK